MDTCGQSFGQIHFGAADLGHKTRNECLIKIADLIQRHPGDTLPNKLHSPKDYKSMDRLMNRKEVTHPAVLKPHCQRTLELMHRANDPLLVLHDTTELDYTGLRSISDLGSIGCNLGRGYLCHNSLVYDPVHREVLGLANQILHVRRLVGRKEGVKKKRERGDRESRLWIEAVSAIGPTPEGKLWVHVADRGSDTFEHLAKHVADGTSFLIRTTGRRLVHAGHEETGPRQDLRKLVGSLKGVGRKTIQVGARDGLPARTAVVEIAHAEITVHPPHVRRGEYVKKPLKLWAVVVREQEAPVGREPLFWVLLTNVPVRNRADAWERCEWYGMRWVIEEYHKGQKTGCGIENLQFASSQALKPMIALLSVVAVTLLNLRDAGRDPDKAQRPAMQYVEPCYVEILAAWRYKDKAREMTVRDFYLALARLGGHQNRKGDKPPGWIVLWKGWMAMQSMLDGARAMECKFRG